MDVIEVEYTHWAAMLIIGIILIPLIASIPCIWAFNRLTNLNISYNAKNWFAMAILVAVIVWG